MAATVAQRSYVHDAKTRAKRKRVDDANAEKIARLARGEPDPDPKAKQRDWLKSKRLPAGTDAAVKPYWNRLKEWLPDGIRSEDLAIVLMLAESMYLVDYHLKLSTDESNEDRHKDAAARDRAIANVERYHKQLIQAVERRATDEDGLIKSDGPTVLVGNF